MPCSNGGVLVIMRIITSTIIRCFHKKANHKNQNTICRVTLCEMKVTAPLKKMKEFE